MGSAQRKKKSSNELVFSIQLINYFLLLLFNWRHTNYAFKTNFYLTTSKISKEDSKLFFITSSEEKKTSFVFGEWNKIYAINERIFFLLTLQQLRQIDCFSLIEKDDYIFTNTHAFVVWQVKWVSLMMSCFEIYLNFIFYKI